MSETKVTIATQIPAGDIYPGTAITPAEVGLEALRAGLSLEAAAALAAFCSAWQKMDDEILYGPPGEASRATEQEI